MHLYLAFLFHRDYFRRSDASLSCSFAPQGLFLPVGFIPSLLFCSTGIISAGRMHLYLALFFHRDYFRRSDASLSCSFVTQGLFLQFRPAECISILLFSSTGIISAGRIHLYLPLLLHRDYFDRPDASLSSSFAPQGLFPAAECISILLFSSTGIISTGQMHLYLALLLHMDYFRRSDCIPAFLFCPTGIISAGRMHLCLPLLLHRDYFRPPNSSLSCSFVPQGLFRPAGCISIFLFCFTEIISADRIHPCPALFHHRDYFGRLDASPACFFAPQGLFPPSGFISILLFCYTGMISTGRMHLYLALLLHRDYFRRPDSSPACSFVPQGLFRPAECISILLFSSTGIISAGRIHLYLPLLLHRDDFCLPDSSPACSFLPQGLFPAAECISIFLFCSTGIISAARIHPQLALLFHRDYFGQPNASLIRAPVKYQRPNFYYTGNTRMASADTLCKKLLPDRQKQSVLSPSILYFCRYGDILFW